MNKKVHFIILVCSKLIDFFSIQERRRERELQDYVNAFGRRDIDDRDGNEQKTFSLLLFLPFLISRDYFFSSL